MTAPDRWVGIKRACEQFGLSRSGFRRMLKAHPELETDGVVMRIPPIRGYRKVGLRAMEAWLRSQNGVGE